MLEPLAQVKSEPYYVKPFNGLYRPWGDGGTSWNQAGVVGYKFAKPAEE